MTDEYPRNRDPLDILIARESKTCKGCVHEMEGILWGYVVTICDLKKKHGRRCDRYDGEKGKA